MSRYGKDISLHTSNLTLNRLNALHLEHNWYPKIDLLQNLSLGTHQVATAELVLPPLQQVHELGSPELVHLASDEEEGGREEPQFALGNLKFEEGKYAERHEVGVRRVFEPVNGYFEELGEFFEAIGGVFLGRWGVKLRHGVLIKGVAIRRSLLTSATCYSKFLPNGLAMHESAAILLGGNDVRRHDSNEQLIVKIIYSNTNLNLNRTTTTTNSPASLNDTHANWQVSQIEKGGWQEELWLGGWGQDGVGRVLILFVLLGGCLQDGCSYNKQRMDYQSDFDDLFHKNPRYSHNDNNPLSEYISPEPVLLDLPMQISNNPFAHPRKKNENRPLYSKNNQSISKCAVTEMSSKADEDYEESITPVCQRLFDHTYSQIEKEFDLMQTLPTEVITEATFKPNDLKEYLRQSKEKDRSKIKQILKENVFSQNKNTTAKEPKRRVVSSQVIVHVEQCKQKTKYQRILQEYFNSKAKKETIKSRLSREKLPDYRVQYNEEAQTKQLQTNKQYQDIQRPKIHPRSQSLAHSKSQKQIPQRQKESVVQIAEKGTLTKTFSQHHLGAKPKQPSKQQMNEQLNDGWMMMNFEQRQSKTLQNRKSKEKVGQRLNQQKQVKNCTFKPTINDFKPSKPQQNHAGSYAKLYYQKIRRRL